MLKESRGQTCPVEDIRSFAIKKSEWVFVENDREIRDASYEAVVSQRDPDD